MAYEKLLSPMKIGSLEVRNRFVQTAMGVGVSNYDGSAKESTVAYYGERAKGGMGLIISEYTRVNESDGMAGPAQLSLSDDKYIEPLRKVTDEVHKYGGAFFIQLHHPGRQNVTPFVTTWPLNEAIGGRFPAYWDLFFKVGSLASLDMLDNPVVKFALMHFMKPVKAPSEVPCGIGVNYIRNMKTAALTNAEVKQLVRQFIDGAVRAKKAGADGVELHASHGYLIQEFLSPYTNKRTDEYGGSLENRCRFIKEMIDGIRKECGEDYPISVRLTADEMYDKVGYPGLGITLDMGVEIAKLLESYGVDAINVSAGSYDVAHWVIEPIGFEPGWRTYQAKAIKEAVSIPVIGVGIIREPDQMEKLLDEGYMDFIGLGRPTLADPHIANKVKEGRVDEIQRCICCMYCQEKFIEGILGGTSVECALNPRTCKESERPETGTLNGDGRKVLIIGAGPGGLMAAKEAALRGFDVTVYEKEPVTGGQLQLAKVPPKKDKINWAIEDLTTLAVKAGARIECGKDLSADEIAAEKPYAVILATGGHAVKPGIPGADKAHVYVPEDILRGAVKLAGKNVVVVGSGMTGLETANYLQEQGNNITVIEMAKKIAPTAESASAYEVITPLEEAGAKLLPGRTLTGITDTSVSMVQKNGVIEEVQADAVILALGVKPVNPLEAALKAKGIKTFVVGDAAKPGRVANATHGGFFAAREL